MRYKIPAAPFVRLAGFIMLCFILVSAGAGYWGVVRAGGLYEELDIRRQMQRELSVDRGRILAADGSPMAETRFDDQGEALRYYPYPPLAPVTGHWTLLYGKSGLERAYDDLLAGRRGQQGLHVFDELRHEPIVGADVVTTIQPRVQVSADEQLGNRTGAIIVIEVKTGAVLALASRPTFDPNTYTENAEAIVNDPAQPLLNRVTQGVYTPGSVFKVVTLAGALAQNKTTMDDLFPKPPVEGGVFIVEGFPIREGSNLPLQNAPFDLSHALAYSSNVAFAQLALALGPDGHARDGSRLRLRGGAAL